MTKSHPTFAIMGSGGVGGYFGARLVQAGYPVSFIARGAHLRALQDTGLSVKTPDEDFHVEVQATDNPSEIGPVDFVLFAVKLWDTKEAAQACKSLIGPDTAVISLQNGVSSEDVLSDVLGVKHVMGGVAQISATISKPGHITKVGAVQLIKFGELDRQRSKRAEVFEQTLADAGIDVGHSDDITADIWGKFVFLVALSATTAVTRRPIGDIRNNPQTLELFHQVMNEVYAVGVAKGVDLNEETLATCLKFMESIPHEVRASMAIDLNQGRRLELPWLSGAVVSLGAELGVATAANAIINSALTLHVMGAVNSGD